MRRVVVTGTGAFTPLGCNLADIVKALRRQESGICEMPEWREFAGLRSYLAAPVKGWTLPPHFDRKVTRSMSRAGELATHVTELALQEAKLLGTDTLSNGKVGVAYGSCLGGPDALIDLAGRCQERSFLGLAASSFLQMMSHTCAANISLHFGTKGRLIPTCSACTSGSQAIGLSYEFIRGGLQDVMIAGGAEELCVGLAALFNSMGALSRHTENTPRPFDTSRDGIVIGEGAATLILEELSHAQRRGAKIIAEILGFATNSDGQHMTNPSSTPMADVMRTALENAGVLAADVDFVHAHATGTPLGDAAEAKAIAMTFGPGTPVTALKSYFGHTLGACGALEAASLIACVKGSWIPGIRNLSPSGPYLEGLNLVAGEGKEGGESTFVLNTFAFGGVNTSLVLRVN